MDVASTLKTFAQAGAQTAGTRKPIDPKIFRALVESLEGGEIARIVSIAFFTLFIYEWLITLEKEVEYFWSGSWSPTRCLFLLNRYLPVIVMIEGLACFFVFNPSKEFCQWGISIGFIGNILAIAVIQAILTLRVWYLFPSSRKTRWFAVIAFCATNIFSIYYAALASFELRVLDGMREVVGCRAERPHDFWRMFFPGLILHTLLYVLTAWRALRDRKSLNEAPVLKRLLRDGGFFFLIVFVTVGFTAAGSFLTQYPKINIPIVFSNYLLSVNSIAVSRVMLSIQSLASNLGSDSAWLLNNAELSRVGWRKGSTDNEIIIEKWDHDIDDEESLKSMSDAYAFDSRSGTPMGSIGGRHSPLKVTRVGVYRDSSW